MRIQLAVTDAETDQLTVLKLRIHDAQKLYMALGEIFGDYQSGAKPYEMITFPQLKLNLPSAEGFNHDEVKEVGHGKE